LLLFSFGGYGLALAALALVVFGAIECPLKIPPLKFRVRTTQSYWIRLPEVGMRRVCIESSSVGDSATCWRRPSPFFVALSDYLPKQRKGMSRVLAWGTPIVSGHT